MTDLAETKWIWQNKKSDLVETKWIEQNHNCDLIETKGLSKITSVTFNGIYKSII